ncbi:hypothetical protein CHRY9390_03185 [Chryseobacterium aquaeductus]|uniref:Uncharacterized protein n=1 Tax=Chryseobacterium aquaeductus TaxID=2675056 RepID=A0A9N8MJS3_9FLAO|nr:hypothetical protein [Chryseobacterium aquaeductus]CAA7332462.1 hypothetical protein CHRY9390_03185 [Chryseobacterium potabilaquae]CAD7816517.1 hypothetical protein CHRY9390_03185 [Chryseobacterium aquaeductus]
MSNILAGIFDRHSDYKRLETELEASGFENSDYIVYITDEHHRSQYLVSVEIKDVEKGKTAQDIFLQNSVLKTYLFENMGIAQASYSTVKKYIDARSKAEIHNSPDVRIKVQHDGINSEVKA